MSSAQEPAAQITNTLFPPPPEFYKQFTEENVARYEALIENEAGPSRSPRTGSPGRVELGAEEKQELEGLRASLKPPRADWIEEEGKWVTFGEMHTVSHSGSVGVGTATCPLMVSRAVCCQASKDYERSSYYETQILITRPAHISQRQPISVSPPYSTPTNHPKQL
jgi:hypothetical protein